MAFSLFFNGIARIFDIIISNNIFKNQTDMSLTTSRKSVKT